MEVHAQFLGRFGRYILALKAIGIEQKSPSESRFSPPPKKGKWLFDSSSLRALAISLVSAFGVFSTASAEWNPPRSAELAQAVGFGNRPSNPVGRCFVSQFYATGHSLSNWTGVQTGPTRDQVHPTTWFDNAFDCQTLIENFNSGRLSTQVGANPQENADREILALAAFKVALNYQIDWQTPSIYNFFSSVDRAHREFPLDMRVAAETLRRFLAESDRRGFDRSDFGDVLGTMHVNLANAYFLTFGHNRQSSEYIRSQLELAFRSLQRRLADPNLYSASFSPQWVYIPNKENDRSSFFATGLRLIAVNTGLIQWATDHERRALLQRNRDIAEQMGLVFKEMFQGLIPSGRGAKANCNSIAARSDLSDSNRLAANCLRFATFMTPLAIYREHGVGGRKDINGAKEVYGWLEGADESLTTSELAPSPNSQRQNEYVGKYRGLWRGAVDPSFDEQTGSSEVAERRLPWQQDNRPRETNLFYSLNPRQQFTSTIPLLTDNQPDLTPLFDSAKKSEFKEPLEMNVIAAYPSDTAPAIPNEQIKVYFEGTNRFLRRCNIQIRQVSVLAAPESVLFKRVGPGQTGNTRDSGPNTQFGQLAVNTAALAAFEPTPVIVLRRPDSAALFAQKGIVFGLEGSATLWRNTSEIIVAGTAEYWGHFDPRTGKRSGGENNLVSPIIAHELGHNLGLEHPGDPEPSIMNNTFIGQENGAGFTDRDCRQLRKDSRLVRSRVKLRMIKARAEAEKRSTLASGQSFFDFKSSEARRFLCGDRIWGEELKSIGQFFPDLERRRMLAYLRILMRFNDHRYLFTVESVGEGNWHWDQIHNLQYKGETPLFRVHEPFRYGEMQTLAKLFELPVEDIIRLAELAHAADGSDSGYQPEWLMSPKQYSGSDTAYRLPFDVNPEFGISTDRNGGDRFNHLTDSVLKASFVSDRKSGAERVQELQNLKINPRSRATARNKLGMARYSNELISAEDLVRRSVNHARGLIEKRVPLGGAAAPIPIVLPIVFDRFVERAVDSEVLKRELRTDFEPVPYHFVFPLHSFIPRLASSVLFENRFGFTYHQNQAPTEDQLNLAVDEMIFGIIETFQRERALLKDIDQRQLDRVYPRLNANELLFGVFSKSEVEKYELIFTFSRSEQMVPEELNRIKALIARIPERAPQAARRYAQMRRQVPPTDQIRAQATFSPKVRFFDEAIEDDWMRGNGTPGRIVLSPFDAAHSAPAYSCQAREDQFGRRRAPSFGQIFNVTVQNQLAAERWLAEWQ